MAIKDIFTLVDLYDESMPGPSAAIALAGTLEAHVTGLALAMEPLAPGFLASPIPADYIVGALEEAQRQAEDAARRFKAKTDAAGIAAEARTLTVLAGASSPILTQAHLSDLVVIGQEDYDRPEPMRGTLIEAVMFEAGVPLLLIPKGRPYVPAFGRAVVAWDGSSTSARAVHAALPLLERFGAVEITIVETRRDWAGEPGADVATYLARHGLDVTIAEIPNEGGDVAATLNRHVTATRADLLVMGAYGHSRLREFIIGGATRGILESMAVPTLMVH